MTNFKIGDYVEICHKPDTRWWGWDKTAHSHFCGKIGFIESFTEDLSFPDDPNEELVKVNAYIHEPVFASGPGLYFVYFKKRHLIKSSESAAHRQDLAYEAAEETNHFEEFTKNKRDEIFRTIFGIEDRKKKKPIIMEEEWEMKTPIFVYDDGDPII